MRQPRSEWSCSQPRAYATIRGFCLRTRIPPRWSILGDPTEAALLVAAQKGGIDLAERSRQLPRLRELHFESNRKRMSTVHPDRNAQKVAYIKGAPKEVLDLCTRYRQSGQDLALDDALREQIMTANDDYARNGLRVLAISVRRLTKEVPLPVRMSDYTPELIEQDMTFLGLIAMADPPREEVAAAVERCFHAGIRIIMITGDYGLTAETIARRIGIIKGEHARIITGVELEKLSQPELEQALLGEVIIRARGAGAKASGCMRAAGYGAGGRRDGRRRERFARSEKGGYRRGNGHLGHRTWPRKPPI